MARRIGVFVPLLMFCVCLSILPVLEAFAAASSDAFELSSGELAYLDTIRSKPLVLGFAGGIMSFDDVDGNPSGMLLPLTDLLEDEFGLKVQTRRVKWGDAFEQLDSGAIDMFGLIALSDTRSNKYLATDSLYASELDVYTRANSPLNSLVNLEGKRIAFLKDSVLPQTILKYIASSTTVVYYDDINGMLSALESGEANCLFIAQSIQAELMDYPDVQYEFSVTGVRVSQGIYSANQELKGLIDIINRYLGTERGKRLVAGIKDSRAESMIQAARIHLYEDIKYVRQNYGHLRIFDSGTLYPLCYIEGGTVKGLQKEINDVFGRLTGMEIEVCPPSDYVDGLISAIGMINSGELVAVTSIQMDSNYARNSKLLISRPVITDHLRLYAPVGNDKELKDMVIGTTISSVSYVDWTSLVERPPVVYASGDMLMGALKRGEIDAAFFGEMNADYYYTVQKDYTLERVGDISVDTAYYIMMSRENQSFNRIFTEASRLQRMLQPETWQMWAKASSEDKFAFMRLQSRISGYQHTIMAVCIILVLVFIAFLFLLWRQYKKFSTYDRQISLMLSVQKNADMIWGSVSKGTLLSKGNFPIFRNWHPDTPELFDDSGVSDGLLEDIKNDIGKINESGLPYNISEKMYSFAPNGDKYYLRRYTHQIGENDVMALLLDITDEKHREAALSELANTDYLSKLRNRRSMQDMLNHMAAKSSLPDNHIVIVMIDIDNFKSVNDSYGHDIGDEVLVGVAATFSEVAPSCLASRWGGEEFLLAVEAETLDSAVETVERIREAISRKVFNVGTRKSFSVTVSCGVSELLPDIDVQQSIAEADEAMYTAKKSGKNRVITRFSAGSYDTVYVN